MNILGLSCYYHDSASCLIKEGEVIAAIEEERFSRIKHDSSFPMRSIEFCLHRGKIQTCDLDYVVFHEKPFIKLERLLKTIGETYPASLALFQEVMVDWMTDKLWIKSHIEEKLGIPAQKIKFCDHHLSHAASSFYCSPFKEAAILTCDGVGEWATTTLGIGQADWKEENNNRIHLFDEIRFPHSLGLLYSAFTSFLGFEVNEGEYKVMGMAAFGKPKYVNKVYELIKLNTDSSFWLDMKYLCYHYSTKKSFNKRFEKLFGKPRDPEARFVTSQTSLYDDVRPSEPEEIEKNQYYADIASSIQKVTEDTLVKMAHFLYKKTALKKLCLAGGVTLNCLANSRIFQETDFDEIFIQPAAGDAGAAMGAALYLYHSLLQHKRKFVLDHVYWGPEYSQEEIGAFLDSNNIAYRHFDDENQLLADVVQALKQGQVIGWFQGRSEWGPRALGNRSILADPRDNRMKDIVNIKIKFREPFRPFAPTVLADYAQDFFTLNKNQHQYPLKFMLYTVPVKKVDEIPATTHVDGSSRLQILQKTDNPRFYRLIEEFFKTTGVPVLLNTSFNLKGEPIVQTPQDAFRTFSNSSMDMLVLGNFIIQK